MTSMIIKFASTYQCTELLLALNFGREQKE